jgi:16S rRNA (uracil1498-N3)-methyltransferase
MSLPRFYLPPEQCAGATLRLDGREAHHALHVLRLKHGELVAVLDGNGNEFMCTVENAARNAVTLSVSLKNFVPAPPCSVTLLVGVPKGKIIESIIQKAVELGARRIVPILSERVVTQLDGEDAENKRAKWQNVAIEAIKQCGAVWLPKVEVPMTIAEVGSRKSEVGSEAVQRSATSAFSLQPSTFDLSLVGSLQKERRHPREVLREFELKHGRLPHSVGVWVGPEGDFTLDELKAIQDSGAQPVSLGRLVLRVETAAVYCLSILNYELQRD